VHPIRQPLLRLSLGFALFVVATSAWAGAKEDGYAALGAKKYEEAVKLLGQARVQSPEDLDLGNALGTALYRSGRYREAEQIFEALANHAPSDLAAARARYNAGNAAYRGGRLDQALANYQQSMGKDPQFADAQKNATAVQKEIQARRNQPPPESDPQDQSGDKSDQSQDSQGQQGQPQDGQNDPNSQKSADQQAEEKAGTNGEPKPDPAAADPGDGTREAPAEAKDPAEGDPAEGAQPADGATAEAEEPGDSGAAEDDARAAGQGMSKADAARLVDSVPDGKPRVVVGQASGGKDW
jgi:Ca-activated chloride channel family protein